MFRRPDGTSVFRPKHSTVCSSELLLAAEGRLLDRARMIAGSTIPLSTVERIAAKPDWEGRVLSEVQASVLASIACLGASAMSSWARLAPEIPHAGFDDIDDSRRLAD